MISTNFIENSKRAVITTEDISLFEKFKSENYNLIIIGVHSGVFHCDEVLATLMLKYHPQFSSSVVVRSRNQNILTKCDIVCDVGGEYNPSTMRFDHHMRDFKECYDEEHSIKMSSAGLIYKHFGREIIENYLKSQGWYEQNINHIDKIVKYLYTQFIMSVDANDNGINAYPDNILPKFIDHTELKDRISRLNPEWNIEGVDVNERFKKAWDVAEEEFYYQTAYYANSFFLAYDIVLRAVKNRFNVDKEGRVIVLERRCPWKDILFTIEKEEKITDGILFVLFENPAKEFVVSTVSVQLKSYVFRKGLPKEWRGLRENELRKVSEIDDAIFVHPSGFIGAAKSFESAKKMAIAGLKEKEE